ncbi:CarboxypepD_reg-like domain-containing protein [Flavobacteriaceae bacterium MAR_2010_188]|nr:CarboxypepD_reg-like domain-containing protein [Flavobacteriaceae bacterium MAR_2010_188]
MKKSLLIVLLLTTTFLFAQQTNRVEITGKVVVESNDIEGITVFNSSSNNGTITNENGEFVISAQLNDKIEFAAIQFKDFDIVVDETVINTKQMTVYLVEQVNKLDEVLILPYKLTGNLDTDVASVRTFNPDIDAIYFGINHSSDYEFSEDNRSAVENEAMHSQSDPAFRNGLNIKNIGVLLISSILSSSNDKKDNNQVEESALKRKYNIDFISTNFDIPRNQVDEFIAYVEANGLNDELMKDEQEIELLQFLYSKRDEFIAVHEKKN